ncbi:transmembrane protein 45A isoform X2 [Heterocephalus glaber]|uniref:Transmembrane protein 45A isoform X2 n=1 Tax=Heterocephalus glaber TaxID=10181 RepID=A0AAX6R2W8_HETGA|nr:transmembrane protein 45A isoform X2 [Heterocephalus glaber]
MGSFKGHALPGSFLFIMGVWWSTKSILKYVCKKQKRTCYLGSKALFRWIEILEGIILVLMALTGMLGEQFISGGPYLILYKEGQWNQLIRWHHCTMYFFFGLLGVANILCFTISSLPVSLPKLMFSNALFVESLLVFIEFFTRNNVLLELLRSSLILLQGSWFWQVGFVLYPPSGSPAWDLTDHDNIMFLTICFCWHYALAYIIIGVNYAFVTWFVKSRLRRLCSSEIGLLKNAEREHESEEEM